jgi:hypothetical protein
MGTDAAHERRIPRVGGADRAVRVEAGERRWPVRKPLGAGERLARDVVVAAERTTADRDRWPDARVPARRHGAQARAAVRGQRGDPRPRDRRRRAPTPPEEDPQVGRLAPGGVRSPRQCVRSPGQRIRSPGQRARCPGQRVRSPGQRARSPPGNRPVIGAPRPFGAPRGTSRRVGRAARRDARRRRSESRRAGGAARRRKPAGRDALRAGGRVDGRTLPSRGRAGAVPRRCRRPPARRRRPDLGPHRRGPARHRPAQALYVARVFDGRARRAWLSRRAAGCRPRPGRRRMVCGADRDRHPRLRVDPTGTRAPRRPHRHGPCRGRSPPR